MGLAEIMIVEDNTMVAEDCRECLENLGYSVSSIVASGEESIEIAEEKQPDAVLMDIRLRDRMDGIEAAEQIHARLDIPVVFLSAYSDRNLLERAKQVGSFGYLIKPFEERELYATLEMALYKAKTEKEQKKLIRELQDALAKVKMLKGLLPICANCKKIRDDKGYWNQIEAYIRDHSEANFTHGICPECFDKLYSDL